MTLFTFFLILSCLLAMHMFFTIGTVMSNTWGLAKKGTSIAVRVLDQNGSGTTT